MKIEVPKELMAIYIAVFHLFCGDFTKIQELGELGERLSLVYTRNIDRFAGLNNDKATLELLSIAKIAVLDTNKLVSLN